MKYCNNCGNQLQEGQRFCDKCGKSVNYANLGANNNNNKSPQPPKKNGGKIAMIIISILVFLLLVAGLLFGAYKLIWDNNSSIFNGSNTNSQSSSNSNNSTDDSNVDGAPNIDVLTSTFNSEFMNQDRRQGFGFIQLGMSRAEVENKFGKPDDTVTIAGASASKYGSIAAHYDNDVVDRYFVVPENDITVQQFTSQHGEPTMKADEGGVVYDDNTDNAFTIKVYVDDTAKVTGIENVDAIERSDSSSSDSEEGQPVKSEQQAESMADEYLSKVYDDYWIHSVDEYKGVYRINYGKDGADHAHDALYLDQETGHFNEVDPNGVD